MPVRTPLRLEPWVLAAVLGAVYVVLAPASADLAAQIYRTELFREEGFILWNGQWYGGHPVPGYSVLFPPLAAVLTPRLVGALAAVAAAALFARLAEARFGEHARLGVLWFGAGVGAMLFTGRLTFLLGVAVGLGALLAAQRERRWPALGLAAATTLASPVAGLFLALAAGAWWLTTRRKLAALVGGAALGPALALSIAFPEKGVEPFVASAFWPAAAFSVAAVVLLPRENRTLRVGAALYGLACLAAFLVDTPMGGNATRLGALFGGPVLACALLPQRKVALASLALPLLWWQVFPPVRDVARTVGDPSTQESYYRPLLMALGRLSAGEEAGRLEIPFTKNHWEVVHVAPKVPLARGWVRQLDVQYNRLFYAETLGPRRYRRWLDANGVRYVALPDAPLDYTARNEARLIRGGLPYLRPVWSNEHWRLYEVRDPRSLVTGPGELRRLGTDDFTLLARRPGRFVVRVRYQPYWRLAVGAGCISPTRDGWTRLELERAGLARVVTSFTPDRIVRRGPRCRRVTG